jgi:hypothetical protein
VLPASSQMLPSLSSAPEACAGDISSSAAAASCMSWPTPTATACVTQLASGRPPTASHSLHKTGHHVHHTACKRQATACITQPASDRPPPASHSLHQAGHQVHHTACIRQASACVTRPALDAPTTRHDPGTGMQEDAQGTPTGGEAANQATAPLVRQQLQCRTWPPHVQLKGSCWCAVDGLFKCNQTTAAAVLDELTAEIGIAADATQRWGAGAIIAAKSGLQCAFEQVCILHSRALTVTSSSCAQGNCSCSCLMLAGCSC